MTKPFFFPIFSMLVLLHVALVLLMNTEWAVDAVWLTNVVSATLFLPLLLFKIIGLPVFGYSEGFGWPPFTILGWLFLCLFWATVYWGVATLANRLLLKIRPTHHSSETPNGVP